MIDTEAMAPRADLTPRADLDERPLKPALWRGVRCRCPQCGEASLFSGFLKVRAACPSCGEALHHQRADDGPAYLTILIVGHVIAPLIHVLYARFQMPPLAMALTLSALAIVLSLVLLPRIKGAFVALQWAKRMHGFGSAA